MCGKIYSTQKHKAYWEHRLAEVKSVKAVHKQIQRAKAEWKGGGGAGKVQEKDKLRNMKPWTLEMLIERHFMKTKKEENKQCVKPLQKKKVRKGDAFPLVQYPWLDFKTLAAATSTAIR